MRAFDLLRQTQRASARSAAALARELVRAVLEISHNTLAVVGLVAIGMLTFGASRADLRGQIELVAMEWLQTRHEAREPTLTDPTPDAPAADGSSRATAADLAGLPREQATLAAWIARRYKVAPEPIGALVQEAWAMGLRAGLDPTLILAVMAVESSFNPFAQSAVGAQGLMQVMTRVHDDKYEAFGGTHAAFDPISNLRVGVLVLKESIAAAGNLDGGLRRYLGVTPTEGDRGYVNRVLAEQGQMRGVAAGRSVPAKAPGSPTAAPAKAAEAPSAPVRAATDDPVVALLR